MKTILKAFAAIGFALISYITVSVVALTASLNTVDMDYVKPIAIISAFFGGLAGWYRVR